MSTSYRIMRIIVLFDLPVMTPKERRAANQFRHFLIGDGFDMLQYSIYARICANSDIKDKHIQRVRREAPSEGSVRILSVTENQFTNMDILVGEKTSEERNLSAKQLAIF
jgi:CRISPR-associated protein Cas2